MTSDATDASDERTKTNQARFNQAAQNYFSPALSFFDTLGEKLIESLGVSEGDRVLDVGCGTGALTLPAAKRVGSSGRVVGADISAGMLDVARQRSDEAGQSWCSYLEADISTLKLEEQFDYGVCGFVTQMFDDLTTVPRTLARHVQPGGKIGLSIWGKGSWEPHTTVFNEVLVNIRPDLVPKSGSIDKLQQPGVIESITHQAGISEVEIETIDLPHRLPSFDDYRHLITTLGSRAVLEKLNESEISELMSQLEPAISETGDGDGSITLSMATLFVRGVVR